MAGTRDAYVAAADLVAELLDRAEVAAAWEASSALPEWTVGGLAGHLAGQVLMVDELLQAPPAEQPPIGLTEHYARAAWVTAAVDDEVNVGIRAGGDAIAVAGPGPLLTDVLAARERVVELLARAPADRWVLLPWQGWSLLLEDFLVTRMMEIAVHSDDVAASVDIEAPTLPPEVLDPVLALLTRLAVIRHGQSAVLAALTRSERAPGSISAF